MIIIRVAAEDTPRDTFVKLLAACKNGRSGGVALTRVTYEGYYYAGIENDRVAASFQSSLKAALISHNVVESMPDGKKFQAARATSSNSGSGVLFSSELDALIDAWIARVFGSRA